MKLFEYYEIRACVEFEDEVVSFTGTGTPETARQAAEAAAEGRPVFWTIYGRDQEGLATAIGDFKSWEGALGILHAILVPIRRAIDNIETTGLSDLEDILNQSTNEERL